MMQPFLFSVNKDCQGQANFLCLWLLSVSTFADNAYNGI